MCRCMSRIGICVQVSRIGLCVQVSRIGLCVQVSRIGLCVQVSRIGLCGVLNPVHSSVSSYYKGTHAPLQCLCKSHRNFAIPLVSSTTISAL